MGKDKEIKVEIAQKVTPVVKAIVTPGLSTINGFEPKPGEYHLVKLDKNSNEIPGSDLSVSERTYNRTFSKLNNYKVKKNPQ